MASIVRITELKQKPLQVILSGQKQDETIATEKEKERAKEKEKEKKEGPVRAASCNTSKTDPHVRAVNPHQDHTCLQSQVGQVESCENKEKCIRGPHRPQINSADTPRRMIFYTPFSNNHERQLKKTISEPFICTKPKSEEDSAKTKSCVEFLPKLEKNFGNSSIQTRASSSQSFLENDPARSHNVKPQPQPENFFGLSTKQLSVGTLQSKQPDNTPSHRRTSSSPPISAKSKISNKPSTKPMKALPNSSLPLKFFDGPLPDGSLPIKVPHKALPDSSLPIKVPHKVALLDGSLPTKVPHKGLTAYSLPNLMGEPTISRNPDQSITEKQSKRTTRPLHSSQGQGSSTDATNLAKSSKTQVLRQSLLEQLSQYQDEIDYTRWISEQHLERIHRSLDHKPSRLVIISSKISQKQFLIDALLPNTFDLIYDYDNFSTTDLIDAIQRKLDGKKVECLLMMCKGGPGYIYLLKNHVVTPQKLKTSDCQALIWFWKSLEQVISKLEEESAAIHILVPRLTDIQQGCTLEQNLQQVLEPFRIHVEAISFSNSQGLKILSMYFNINSLLPWLGHQQQEQQQYVEEGEEEEDIYGEDQSLQDFLDPDYDLKHSVL
ncbi:uncharacterized protein LOC118767452 [Octopus sinensis]|uniref:Uncharacterized protein LOC118767452 n=1 Tax=Octopus sinensis TaxID=2607531 RepID=A0A7E6FK04_9MOLL|nr:uncharacterized protein LOC118767452 [Octopus sinensis]